jgi:hypothetical protein
MELCVNSLPLEEGRLWTVRKSWELNLYIDGELEKELCQQLKLT